MKIQILPARTGLHWFQFGWQIFWRQPLALSLVLGLSYASALALAFIPLVGPILTMVLHPLLTLMMVIAASQAVDGQRVRPALLLRAFRCGRERRRGLLALSALYVLAWLGLLGLTALVDGGSFASMSLGLGPGILELLANPPARPLRENLMSWAMIMLLLLASHAPGLVHWHGVSPTKALRLSAVAWLHNWRAGMVFGLVCTGVSLSLLLSSTTLLNLIGIKSGMPVLFGIGALVLGFVNVMAYLAIGSLAVFLCLRDVFGVPASPPPAPAAEPASADLSAI